MNVIECDLDTMVQSFGVTAQMINKMVRDGVVVRVRRGVYDLAASIRNFIVYRETVTGSASADLTEARKKLVDLQADDLRLELEKKRGTLLEAAAVRDTWSKTFADLRNRLMAAPTWAARELQGVEGVEKTRRIIYDILKKTLDEFADAVSGTKAKR